jgi:NADH-quinone oxidoreductase subunit L
MLSLLWLVPVLPFAGFLILILFGPRMSRRASAAVGVGSVGLSAVVALLVAVGFGAGGKQPFTQVLWTWMQVGTFAPTIGFYLDSLALVMTLVVAVVSFLIHLYSVEYMAEDEGYSRFFAYMNLFVGSMLTLVLADNLLLLYLGWEGVGLCSYLLIGFYYTDPYNGYAARKAFVVTRVGDAAMAVGLFILFTHLGTLQIQDLMAKAQAQWAVGTGLAVAAAWLLLGGAVGKSAQLPLQVWLPDAMAGPTPVSALIHAATMVTAGVYLIARTHVLFQLAPSVMLAVAIVGALTLLIAGFSALVQTDIKRVLAYSTISQIGYMFLALGVGAWSAAIFHFMTHAFFKALLFLGAGAVILAMHHEQNMFKMGGLRTRIPLVFWTFLAGAASLTALPLVTAGFYSKDLILWQAFASESGSVWLWLAGLIGALLTGLYTFRMVFITFYGEPRGEHHGQVAHTPGLAIRIPLVVLAVLAIIGGFVELPRTLGNLPLFSNFMRGALPETALAAGREALEPLFQLIAAIVSLGGIGLAYLFFLRRPVTEQDAARATEGVRGFWFSGWGFDWLYDKVFIRPYVWFAHANKNDFFDLIYRGLARFSAWMGRGLSTTETGRLRWYATGVALGAVLIIAIAVIL